MHIKMGKNINEMDSDLKKLVDKLDNRITLKQELLNEETGQRFKEYCRDNFKGRKYFWIGELEKQLTGKTLKGFRALRDFEDTYEESIFKNL